MLVVFNNICYLLFLESHINQKSSSTNNSEEEEKDDDCDMAVSKNRGRSGKKCHPILQRAPIPSPVPGIYFSVIIGDCIFKEIMLYATELYSYIFNTKFLLHNSYISYKFYTENGWAHCIHMLKLIS